jgi:hypothetical protein
MYAYVFAVRRSDTRAFLSAVLQRVESKEGGAGDIGVPVVYAEDAALVTGMVVVQEIGAFRRRALGISVQRAMPPRGFSSRIAS